MVDSVQVQRLAERLASVKGDSLNAYFRKYWSAKAKHLDVPKLDTPQVAFADSSSDTSVVDTSDAMESLEDVMRQSIVKMETCSAALDSNRSTVAWYNEAYPKVLTSLDSIRTLPQPIPWRALGAGAATGFIFGLVLGR